MRLLAAALTLPLCLGLAALAPDDAEAKERASTREAPRSPAKRKGAAAASKASAGDATSQAKAKGKSASAPKRQVRPCAELAASVGRPEFGERQKLALLDCRGEPTRAAQEHLSGLARHRTARRPANGELAKLTTGGQVARAGVALLDRGLVTRIAALSRAFPGHEVDVVSGFRPDSEGSQHQRARALDVSFRGVSNRTLFEACKKLDDTGCGYYPNSSFVHVDVRPDGLGTSWIDASGPGETPRYVTRWSDGAVAGRPTQVAAASKAGAAKAATAKATASKAAPSKAKTATAPRPKVEAPEKRRAGARGVSRSRTARR